MNEIDLHDVLDRATDVIDAPQLAGSALAVARRRTRRRAKLAAGASGAAIAAIVVAVVIIPDHGRKAGPNPSAPSSTPGTEVRDPAQPPVVDPSKTQPIWDPDRIGSMPWDERLELPRDLTPTGALVPGSSTVLAAADVEGVLWLLLPGDTWVSASYPEAGPQFVSRTIALSDDGGRIAVTGRTGVWWREVAAVEWTRVPYPAGMALPSDYAVSLDFGDVETLVLSNFDRFWTIDLTSGTSRQLPFDIYDDVTALPDGDIVASRFADRSPIRRSVERYRDGEFVQVTDASLLGSLQRAAASDTAIVVTRADTEWTQPRTVTDHDGLLALDLEDLTTRAFLPVEDSHAWYSDAGALTALGWLDEDTVLAKVQPRADTETTWLITWGVESGELRRVASYPSHVTFAFAIDTL